MTTATLLLMILLQPPVPDKTNDVLASQPTWWDAVGVLLPLGGPPCGTAFVAGKLEYVISAGHVAVADTLWFEPYRSGGDSIVVKYRLALDKLLMHQDLSIYRRTGGKSRFSLPIGDFRRLRPGDTLVYCGCRPSDSMLVADVGSVSSIGETVVGDRIVQFVDFQSDHAVPGFSGGPVLNARGEVVAVISGGYVLERDRPQVRTRMLRAHSIDLARLLLENVREFDSR